MTSIDRDWARLVEDMASGQIGPANTYPTLESLAPLIEAKRQDQPLIIGQLGQSLDGRIATASGDSHYINGMAALDHLHRLRALVDAVVVGAGTVASDDPRLTVRRVSGPSPVRIILDPNKRTDIKAHWCKPEDGIQCHRLVREGEDEDSLDIPVSCSEDGKLCPTAVIQALADNGWNRLLIEGGASTVSHWLQTENLDRVHLLIGPLILGDGPMGLDLQPKGDRITDAWKPNTQTYPLPDGDVLIDCDLRTDQPAG